MKEDLVAKSRTMTQCSMSIINIDSDCANSRVASCTRGADHLHFYVYTLFCHDACGWRKQTLTTFGACESYVMCLFFTHHDGDDDDDVFWCISLVSYERVIRGGVGGRGCPWSVPGSRWKGGKRQSTSTNWVYSSLVVRKGEGRTAHECSPFLFVRGGGGRGGRMSNPFGWVCRLVGHPDETQTCNPTRTDDTFRLFSSFVLYHWQQIRAIRHMPVR